MTWRGSIDLTDRIFSVLVYLLALYDAWVFSGFLIAQFPFIGYIGIVLIPIAYVYDLSGQWFGLLGGLLIFFILFVGVVRNPRFSHFLRFNTLQTILIGIFLYLLGLVVEHILIPLFGNSSIITEVLFNIVFIGSLAACIYCMIQSALGRYADLPTISDAAYSQLP